MIANGCYAIANKAGTSHSRGLVMRVAKPCAESNFRNDRAVEDGAANRLREPSRTQGLSQSETAGHAPLWYGSRLRPAFVAQILGQVLYPAPPDATSAVAAYEEGLARGFRRANFDRHV